MADTELEEIAQEASSIGIDQLIENAEEEINSLDITAWDVISALMDFRRNYQEYKDLSERIKLVKKKGLSVF
jgi:hypothetical protein